MTNMAQAEPGIIFINYRKIDAGWPADHLAGKLRSTFGEGRVFLDVRGIEAGDEFAAVIEENLSRASILVVVIGKGWLFVQNEDGVRRLDVEDDWVRKEIRIGLQRQPACRVIPVLIDDARLPDNQKALPQNISSLLALQAMPVRQEHSEDDIEALCREVEKSGFRRLPTAMGPIGGQEFSDREVLDVVVTLRNLQQREGSEFVSRRDLLRELNRLFNRKTFRFETLRGCPEQRWADRLDSAYQTERALRMWERNLREVADEKYPVYVELLREVGTYCMQMGALLFDPAVDYNSVEAHIGTIKFKEKLPVPIRFPVAPDKQPIIPSEINNPIERHRKRAVALMNKLVSE